MPISTSLLNETIKMSDHPASMKFYGAAQSKIFIYLL